MARWLGLVLVVGFAAADLRGAGRPLDATADELQSAIMAGRAAEVQPYALRQSADGRSIVGVVYTQFVRVARYAWLAQRNGRLLEVSDLPSAVKQTGIHVVMQLPTQLEDSSAPIMVAIDRPPSSPAAGSAVYFVPQSRRLLPATGTISIDALEAMVGAITLEKARLVGIFPAELATRTVPEFGVYVANPAGRFDVVSGFAAGPLR